MANIISFIIKFYIILEYSINKTSMSYQQHITDQSLTSKLPFTHVSLSHHHAINDPSTRNHKTPMNTISNRADEIHVMKIKIGAYGIVDNKYAMVIYSTAIEYEFVIVIIIINGHYVAAQTIATKVNIIKLKNIVLQLLIQSIDASSDANINTVIYIKLYDAFINIWIGN